MAKRSETIDKAAAEPAAETKTETATVEKAGTVINPETGEILSEPDPANLAVGAKTGPIVVGARGPTRVGGLIDAEPGDYNFPKLHLYQGTQYEKKAYGKQDDGAWIDAVTCEQIEVEDTRVIIPIFGYKNVCVYGAAMGSGFFGIYPDLLSVPGEYRLDDEAYQVNRQLNWVVLVEGAAYPMIVVFKRTGYRSGQAFAAMVDSRTAMGNPLGQYHLRCRPRSGPKGDSFIPICIPAGDAPDAMRELAEKFAVTFSGGRVTAMDVADAPEAEQPEEAGGEVAAQDGGVPA